MKQLAAISSVMFVVCFVYLMVSAYVLRWMIDEEKTKIAGAKIYRALTPPKELLTPLGVKIWWSRWFVGAGLILFLGVSWYLHHP